MFPAEQEQNSGHRIYFGLADVRCSMGFNRRKMEDQRRDAAENEAATRRATDAQVLEDAERLIAAWNERQAVRAPMIFSRRSVPRARPAIGSCGCVVRLAERSMRSTCARSTVTPTRR